MSDFSDQTPPGKNPQSKTAEQSVSSGLSRRRVFQTLIGSAAAIGAGLALVTAEPADAQAKTPKKVAKYQDHPKNGQQCSKCRFFRPPKSCQLVAGDISPNGWCSFFAAKPA
jgi:High potential iron-sulfur protein